MDKVKCYLRSLGIQTDVIDISKIKEEHLTYLRSEFRLGLNNYLVEKSHEEFRKHFDDIIDKYFEDNKENLDVSLTSGEYSEEKIPYNFKRHVVRWLMGHVTEHENELVDSVNLYFINVNGNMSADWIKEEVQKFLCENKKHKLCQWARGYISSFEEFIDNSVAEYEEKKREEEEKEKEHALVEIASLAFAEILRENRDETEFLFKEKVRERFDRMKKYRGEAFAIRYLEDAVKEEIFNVIDGAEREDELDFHYLDKLRGMVEEFGLRIIYSATEIEWLRKNISYETISLLEEKLGETPMPEIEQTELTFPETSALAAVSPLDDSF